MPLVKITDVLPKKYQGPDQDFASWLTNFELGVTLGELVPKAQVALLQAFLEGDCRQVAVDYIREYEQETPVPAGAAAQRSYYEQQLSALKDYLRQSTTITGCSPEVRLMDKWRTITQKDKEKVQTYYNRVKYLLRQLQEQDPPIQIDDKDLYVTFVNGLRPNIKVHVKSKLRRSVLLP